MSDINEFDELTENIEDRIVLKDETGKDVSFTVLASLCVDDQEYAILEQDNIEDEIILFRIIDTGDDIEFVSVESEKEINEVLEAYQSLISQE